MSHIIFLHFIDDKVFLYYYIVLIKCITTKAANTKGNKKCNAKNLFNVALLTEKPPQINSTIS
jgi:hypothetical protein